MSVNLNPNSSNAGEPSAFANQNPEDSLKQAVEALRFDRALSLINTTPINDHLCIQALAKAIEKLGTTPKDDPDAQSLNEFIELVLNLDFRVNSQNEIDHQLVGHLLLTTNKKVGEPLILRLLDVLTDKGFDVNADIVYTLDSDSFSSDDSSSN